MANNKIEKWNVLYTDPRVVSRTKPRKIYNGTIQANGFGILERIPRCPRCESPESLIVEATFATKEARKKTNEPPPEVSQRRCLKCGYTSGKIDRPESVKPSDEQIAYANRLILETYKDCKERFLKRYPKREPSEDMIKTWKRKAKRIALNYLIGVTNGFDILKIYPHLDPRSDKNNNSQE